MKTILLLILSAFTAFAATTYPVLTDNANRTFSGGATNLALLNGTNVFTGTNTFTAAAFFPANRIGKRILWASQTNIFIASAAVLATPPTNSGDFSLTSPVVQVDLPASVGSNSVFRFGCRFTKTNALASACNIFVYVGQNTNAIYQSAGAITTAVGASGFFNPTTALFFNLHSLTNQIPVPQTAWAGGAADGRNLYPSNYVNTAATWPIYVGIYTATGATNIQFESVWFEEVVLP
jgi:hypothetical protein